MRTTLAQVFISCPVPFEGAGGPPLKPEKGRMKKTTTMRCIWGIVALGAPAVLACGGGEVSSGVDGDKKGSELSTDEVKKVCEAIIEYQNKTIEKKDICKVYGLTAAQTAYNLNSNDESIQKACRDAVESCESDDVESEDAQRVCSSPGDLSQCTATVEEIETCANERVDATVESYRDLPSCASFTRLYFEQDPDDNEEETVSSAACRSVQSKCNVVLKWGGGL